MNTVEQEPPTNERPGAADGPGLGEPSPHAPIATTPSATRLLLGRLLAVALVVATAAGALAVWVGIPYLERRWTFFPEKSADAGRWKVPAGAEAVRFDTSDDVRLAGWYFRAGRPRTGITVLLLHGNEGVLPDYVPEARILQKHGFSVLMFNYRGFGNSDGRTLGEATLALDGEAALRYLATERGIPPASVALLGVSLGTAVAANLAASSPCRAVALLGAFASAKQQALRFKPWLPEPLLDLLNSPFDTVGRIDEARCPVLIVHGANDHEVPFAQARAIYEAAHPPKRLLIVPGAGHGLPVSDNRRYLREVALFFIQRR